MNGLSLIELAKLLYSWFSLGAAFLLALWALHGAVLLWMRIRPR